MFKKKKVSTFRPTSRKIYEAKKKPAKQSSAGNIRKSKGVPLGRTLSTHDHFLGRRKTDSKKRRPVVVIARNYDNDLAVVPLSSRDGKHRTQLKGYQDGKSYFKHFVEIHDNEGNPIRVNEKFRENHPRQDVVYKDVNKIRRIVLMSSVPAPENRKKMQLFWKKKSPRD